MRFIAIDSFRKMRAHERKKRETCNVPETHTWKEEKLDQNPHNAIQHEQQANSVRIYPKTTGKMHNGMIPIGCRRAMHQDWQ